MWGGGEEGKYWHKRRKTCVSVNHSSDSVYQWRLGINYAMGLWHDNKRQNFCWDQLCSRMQQSLWPSSDWHATPWRLADGLKSHTERTQAEIPIVPFITPQVPITCIMEIWWLASLSNVEAAPINIFISAYTPCWKHIQGDFKLYELISYLLRQLSMQTSSLNIFFSPTSSPALISFPSISPHCRNGIWAFGVHAAGNESGELKVSVPFQSFS